MGRAEITYLEIQNAPYRGCSEVTLAHLLKDKGVPLVGTFFPRMAPGLTYTVVDDVANGKKIITWESPK